MEFRQESMCPSTVVALTFYDKMSTPVNNCDQKN